MTTVPQKGAFDRPARTGFRWDLKTATQDDHDRLDRLVSRFDLQRRDDLVRFFHMHLICFQAMTNACPDDAVDAMIVALRADLGTLGADADHHHVIPLPAYHPLAGHYIKAGSRMGTRVLRKRWLGSPDATVLAATRYFNLKLTDDQTSDVWADLDSITPDGATASAIIADTRRLFAGFAAAYAATASSAQVS